MSAFNSIAIKYFHADPTLYHTILDFWFHYTISESTAQIPYSIENIQCTSNETQLSQCNYAQRTTSQDCYRWSKIKCQTGSESEVIVLYLNKHTVLCT